MTLALLSGEVDMIVNDLTVLKSHVASRKLRALAVPHASRLKPLPGVPTFAELGMPGVLAGRGRAARRSAAAPERWSSSRVSESGSPLCVVETFV